MAARKFTGSARIRAAKSKSGSQKTSVEIAEILTRMEDIRAVLISAIDSLRLQNVKIDADVAATLKRRALDPLFELRERLGSSPSVLHRYLMRRLSDRNRAQDAAMSCGDPHELTMALATLVYAHADATALVMCAAPNLDGLNADSRVNTIRFSLTEFAADRVRTDAQNICVKLGVDWKALLAVVSKGEGAAGVQRGGS